MDAATILPYVWPLLLLLLGLIAIRKLTSDIRPVFVSIVSGVAKNAQSNAPAYAIAILFGLSASLSAFVDVFKEMNSQSLSAISWHQYATLWAKVFNPFIVAVLAYATQNKFKGGSAVSATTPPFPAPSSP